MELLIFVFFFKFCCEVYTWNVAENKMTASKNDVNGYPSSRCVDGNVSQGNRDSCCSIEKIKYFEVDLGDSCFVDNVTIYASIPDYTSIRSTVVTLYDNENNPTICGTTTSDKRQNSSRTVICQTKTPTRKVRVKKQSSYPLYMCEVIVNGYKECPDVRPYFYGRECDIPCHCESKCDRVDGECDTCSDFYERSPSHNCIECADHEWGSSCDQQCNCFDRSEVCNHVNGSCTSGCSKWFTGTGCNIEIPRLGDSVVPTAETNLTQVNISFTHVDEFEYIKYRIRYKEVESSTWNTKSVLHDQDLTLGITSIKFDLPEARTEYYICVVPYHNTQSIEGEESACVSVTTECKNGTYGLACQFICTCYQNHVCDKIDGTCGKCNGSFIDKACKISSPTESDIEIDYLGINNNIEVNITLDGNYIKMYTVSSIIIEVLANEKSVNSLNLTIEDSSFVSGLISNLSDNTYTLRAYVNIRSSDHLPIIYRSNYMQEEDLTFVCNKCSPVVENTNFNLIAITIGSSLITVICVAIFIVLIKNEPFSRIFSSTNVDSYPDKLNISYSRETEDQYVNQVNIKNNPDRSKHVGDQHGINKIRRPLQLHELKDHIEDDKVTNLFETEEFSKLFEIHYACKAGEHPSNSGKHRFNNIKAFDHSRVVLEKVENIEGSDYINASYINDYNGQQSFIASQAPRKCTINDMWRMIWQEHINIIMMLTNLREGMKVKCQRYWPESETEDYGNIQVHLERVEPYSFYIERTMTVSYQVHLFKYIDVNTNLDIGMKTFHAIY